MAKDYYSILEISRTANEYEICQAYRRLALKWHPSRNESNQTGAFHMHHSLAEAYEVLSDSAKRSYFDSYGEFGLKEGIPDGRGGFFGGYSYAGNADQIFEQFFGTTNPFFDTFEELGAFRTDTMFGAALRGIKAAPAEAPANLEVEVECTLGELYNGCTKTVAYTKRVLSSDKITTILEKSSKEIEVRQGYSSQTNLIFPGEGNESSGFPNCRV
mmetsp:Transcript_16469/g.29704  ORF Transcript_16469/g.29704 Transcript_16469/m.29704 type:complete len:215 (-) Transcript_16469:393-1037(-)